MGNVHLRLDLSRGVAPFQTPRVPYLPSTSLTTDDARDASLQYSIPKALVPITLFAATQSYDGSKLQVRHGRNMCNAWIVWDQRMVWGCATLSI